MVPSYGRPLTRRRFIGRSATVVAATVGASYVDVAFSAPPSGALSQRHRRTLKALVEALSRSPGSRFEARDANRVVAMVAHDFEAGSDAARGSVEVALNQLDDGRGPGWFASLPVAARLSSLRRQVKRSSSRPSASPPPEYLVQGAIRLAASAVYSPDDPVAIACAP